MYKVLPITDKPYIRTYTYYAYPHAVLDSKEFSGQEVARFEVKEFDRYEWQQCGEGLMMKRCDEKLSFECGEFHRNMNQAYYRLAKSEDEIEVKIDYQQYAQPWGAINLFLADLEADNMNQDDDYLCRIGNFSNEGVYLRVNNVHQKFNLAYLPYPIRFKLVKSKNHISFYVMNGEWMLLRECDIQPKSEEEIKIGVQVKLNDHAYYNWLFMNYIQLYLDSYNEYCKIWYHYGITKNWEYDTVNYFFDFQKIDIYEYKKMNVNILDFIKRNIDFGHYIEIMLDQYYVRERVEYQKQHEYHLTMIYGYDDESESLMILGYASNGKIITDKISYQDFDSDSSKAYARTELTIMKLKEDGRIYNFSVKFMLEMLQQYLNGTNSRFYQSDMMPPNDAICGIKIYDELNTPRGIKIMSRDRRITHLIHEHKVCMKDRIRFLHACKIITDEQFAVLEPQIEEIVHLAINLRNLAIKCGIASSELIVNKLKEKLIAIRDLETVCLESLYNMIEMNIRDAKE